ncbi:MAG: hypothetical protein MI864_02600 [Pseudomonadales bacterium]|uniref:Uncharacterized protein n=1 Tax=Oleiphilus messinensis TaxID=141451 RepID=A0A1Y0IFT7_9GAMM|nr:hypothetical protein [Oleiphilus messinensis]ARU58979.1 hypothetical protein OLMES_4992 [Oleiphilus messinensis]MCG8609401.1 hypothetical protein [Pseudomonadales bacterium]
MILPPEFIDTIDPETRDSFLEHLILSATGLEQYDGDLSADREKLLKALRRGDYFVEHADGDEEQTFGLISRDRAMELGFELNPD